jgi:hypothetical protein
MISNYIPALKNGMSHRDSARIHAISSPIPVIENEEEHKNIRIIQILLDKM